MKACALDPAPAPILRSSILALVMLAGGQTLAEATATLDAAGCAVGTVKRVPARRPRKGRITSQRPASGERVPLGGTVNLKLGRGRPRSAA